MPTYEYLSDMLRDPKQLGSAKDVANIHVLCDALARSLQISKKGQIESRILAREWSLDLLEQLLPLIDSYKDSIPIYNELLALQKISPQDHKVWERAAELSIHDITGCLPRVAELNEKYMKYISMAMADHWKVRFLDEDNLDCLSSAHIQHTMPAYFRLGKELIALHEGPKAEYEVAEGIPTLLFRGSIIAAAIRHATFTDPRTCCGRQQRNCRLKKTANDLTAYAIHPVSSRMPGHMNVQQKGSPEAILQERIEKLTEAYPTVRSICEKGPCTDLHCETIPAHSLSLCEMEYYCKAKKFIPEFEKLEKTITGNWPENLKQRYMAMKPIFFLAFLHEYEEDKGASPLYPAEVISKWHMGREQYVKDLEDLVKLGN